MPLLTYEYGASLVNRLMVSLGSVGFLAGWSMPPSDFLWLSFSSQVLAKDAQRELLFNTALLKSPWTQVRDSIVGPWMG